MPRRERRSVGADVLALAQASSNRLLEREHECFARQEVVWKQSGSDLARSLLAQLGSAGPTAVLSDGRVVRKVVAAAVDASLRAANQAYVLFDEAAKDALASIEAELVLCESTLSKKYAGVAKAGVAEVHVPDLIQDARKTYGQRMDLMLFQFEHAVRGQADTALAGQESSQQVLARMLSTEPVNLPNRSGRGVWWGNLSDCQAAARESSIRLADRVRLTAMDGMNQAGVARGR